MIWQPSNWRWQFRIWQAVYLTVVVLLSKRSENQQINLKQLNQLQNSVILPEISEDAVNEGGRWQWWGWGSVGRRHGEVQWVFKRSRQGLQCWRSWWTRLRWLLGDGRERVREEEERVPRQSVLVRFVVTLRLCLQNNDKFLLELFILCDFLRWLRVRSWILRSLTDCGFQYADNCVLIIWKC